MIISIKNDFVLRVIFFHLFLIIISVNPEQYRVYTKNKPGEIIILGVHSLCLSLAAHLKPLFSLTPPQIVHRKLIKFPLRHGVDAGGLQICV